MQQYVYCLTERLHTKEVKTNMLQRIRIHYFPEIVYNENRLEGTNLMYKRAKNTKPAIYPLKAKDL